MSFWSDRSFLRDVQYRTDANLAARQSIYAYQHHGEVLLRGLFASVARYEFRGRLVVPDPEPVAAYVRSMSLAARLGDPDALVRAVVARLPSGPGATFLDTTHSGCLVCS